MRPSAAVITNVEADHLENHGDLEGIFRAFEQFVDRVDPAGALLISADDPGARRIAEYARATRPSGADVRVGARRRCARHRHHTSAATASTSSSRGGPIATPIAVRVGALIGVHMAHNAAAALALAADLGMDRRARSSSAGPTSPACTAASSTRAKPAACTSTTTTPTTRPRSPPCCGRPVRSSGDGRLIAVFQPGTYSRTQTFAAEFAQALALADIAVVLDIFPAREEPIPGVTGATITDLIELPAERVVYEPSFAAAPGPDRCADPAGRRRRHDGHRQRLPAVRRDPRPALGRRARAASS